MPEMTLVISEGDGDGCVYPHGVLFTRGTAWLEMNSS